ncbi:MAG: HPF/RaiA family ribosome-associated protein [Candidatus Aminicenantes bacterium]|nr:MAG: HPF/RaiA family ribosome-associated protein [Candidatus Aminicenantes bacterium]
MSIKFTSKSIKLPGAMKAFAEKNLTSIEKISGEIIDAEVIVSQEKLDYKVEVSVKTRMQSYHLEDKNPILKQALRTTLNTLKAQAKKTKEKLKKDKKRRNKEKTGTFKQFAARAAAGPREVASGEENLLEKIRVSNNYSRKPIPVEEAIFFLKESGENAYMFTNAETNRLSVIFYDDGKNLSIIEAS